MRRPQVIVLAGLMVFVAALSGCAKSAEIQTQADAERPDLAAGKGAISGLVIDDRYRPVPDALVVLTPGGLTTTSDTAGQFSFSDLTPGPYLLQVQAADHEAA